MGDARDRWLDEGVRVLAAEGSAGLRIDRLAARLGLSKGSFHHHFDGADGYRRALLAHVERLAEAAVDAAVAQAADAGDVRSVLARLTALVEPAAAGLYRPELDVALRAWATTDDDARAVQARIDGARLEALERVWRPHTGSAGEARRAALLPYLALVGAAVVVPPVGAAELRAVLEQLLPLVPEGDPATGA